MSQSIKIYLSIVFVLSLLSAVNIYTPIAAFFPIIYPYQIEFSTAATAMLNFFIIFFIYFSIGAISISLLKRAGFVDIWDPSINLRQRFILPFFSGLLFGFFFILADYIFSFFHPYGVSPHPPFPLSITASLAASIWEEILFRLFLIALIYWPVLEIANTDKWKNRTFWSAVTISAACFVISHLPFVMSLIGVNQISHIPPALLSEIIILNSLLSVAAAYYLRKYGLIAAIGVHFWTDIMWHVIGGMI